MLLEQLATRGTPVRRFAIAVLALLGVAVITQFVMPGTGARRGTPTAILFQSAVFGALNAMTALGIVLVYRTSRIINFAQAALGAVGALFAYNLMVVYNVPFGLAFVVAILLSAAVAVGLELLFVRRFFEAPRLVLTIITIGFMLLITQYFLPLLASADWLWGEGRDPVEALGGVEVRPLPSFEFTVGGLGLPFGFAHIFALVVVAAALAGLGAFLRYTRMGVAIRASSENAERAELLGINVGILSTVVWGIAGALAGAGVTVQGTVSLFTVSGQGAPEVLLVALAAAVIARMQSLPVAVFAAVALTVLQGAIGWSYQGQSGLIFLVVFLVVAFGLLAQRRALQRAEEVSSWSATEEIRPTPRELLAVPGIRFWRAALMLIGVGAVLLLPWIAGTGQTNLAALAAIVGIVLLSLVVLTGWAGQVSLAQFAFVAIGAVVGGALTAKVGISFWLALPATAVITAVVAVIVGLPALRIKGLFLAVVTFAFAGVVHSLLFSERYFGWLLPEAIERPTLLLLDFEDERSMFYLCLLALVLSVAVLLVLRRSRPGRVLIALRENETELQSFGINVVRTKLAAFGLAGFLCGIAGTLWGHHQRALSQSAFEPQASIEVFVFAVIGGISSVSGALVAGGLWAGKQVAPGGDPIVEFFLNEAFIILVLLYLAPGGFASILYGLRDSVLRIVAQRRQMIVPALFADYDPEALERQLIPLAEKAGTEVAGLPAGERYRLSSELYGVRPTGEGRTRAPDDTQALGAAAERVAET